MVSSRGGVPSCALTSDNVVTVQGPVSGVYSYLTAVTVPSATNDVCSMTSDSSSARLAVCMLNGSPVPPFTGAGPPDPGSLPWSVAEHATKNAALNQKTCFEIFIDA